MLSSRLLINALACRGLVTSRVVTTGCWPGITRTKSKMNSSAVWTISAPFVGRPRAVSLSISNFRGCFTPPRVAAWPSARAQDLARAQTLEVEARPADVGGALDRQHQQPVAARQWLEQQGVHVLVEDGQVGGALAGRGRRPRALLLADRPAVVPVGLASAFGPEPVVLDRVEQRGERLGGGQRVRGRALHALEQRGALAGGGDDLAVHAHHRRGHHAAYGARVVDQTGGVRSRAHHTNAPLSSRASSSASALTFARSAEAPVTKRQNRS